MTDIPTDKPVDPKDDASATLRSDAAVVPPSVPGTAPVKPFVGVPEASPVPPAGIVPPPGGVSPAKGLTVPPKFNESQGPGMLLHKGDGPVQEWPPIIPDAPVAEMQGILSVEAQKLAGLLQAGSPADLQSAASVLKKDILSLNLPGDTPTAFYNQQTLIDETNRLAANTGARITHEPLPGTKGWPHQVELFIEKGKERIDTGAIVDVPPPPMFPEIPPKPGELK